MRSGAPNTASAASPWNLLINPSRWSTAATTIRKKSLSTSDLVRVSARRQLCRTDQIDEQDRNVALVSG